MRSVALAALLVGCSDPAPAVPDAMPDAAPQGPCWPDIQRTPHGTATLGAGLGGYQAMPATLRLDYGAQAGFMVIVNVRMQGFAPGNTEDILDPSNLRTRIRAFFADTGVPLNYYGHCPFRLGYVPLGADDFQLKEDAPIVFETCWRSDHLIGKRLRVELEVLDKDGNYTTDSKIITAAEPTSPYPIEMNSPPCVHP